MTCSEKSERQQLVQQFQTLGRAGGVDLVGHQERLRVGQSHVVLVQTRLCRQPGLGLRKPIEQFLALLDPAVALQVDQQQRQVGRADQALQVRHPCSRP